ncbi:Vitamin B12-binding protein [Sinobacterium norvegicum]|uniref:Vitamin B12-binding protein n=1 Tax=Sinobacterium norvegicum TaxID=1641715 RepID=A0ABN8EDZ1_9GAMM|nr:ABC transporter substrate-binding protein [Sinobacterium norvegicum]CAH0990542.1 Vitamin B12-binding protein [Sinobacterium norvegicum]
MLLSIGVHAEAPQRVLSVNLCTDQILLALAAPEQIVAVSTLADDPLLSNYVEQAKRYPQVGKDAEQIAGFMPDLILATNYTDPVLSNWLRRFDYPIKAYTLPDTLVAVDDYIVDVAARLGREKSGEKLAEQYNQRLTLIEAVLPPVSVVVIAANLYVAGKGTFPDQILSRMGAVNAAASTLTSGWGYISLEQLLHWQPDYIILQRDSANGASRAEQVLNHRVMRTALSRSQFIDVPAKQWICAGPELMDAAETIKQQIMYYEGQ